MAQIETLDQWIAYVNQISTDLRTTLASIVDRNRQIQAGVPKETLARQNVTNQRNLHWIEGLFFLILAFLLFFGFMF